MTYTIGTQFGHRYHKTRKAEPRLVGDILDKVKDIDINLVADIGSGVCNYSYEFAKRGYRVTSIEPSAVMLEQAKSHYSHKNITHISSTVETLDQYDVHADLAVCILSFHHFTNINWALRNIKNIKGLKKLILFTIDHNLCNNFWFEDYFPKIWNYATKKMFVSLQEQLEYLEKVFSKEIEVYKWEVPKSCKDLFFGSGWENPKLYTNKVVYENTTPLLKADNEVIDSGISNLIQDIESGLWEEKYSVFLSKKSYDVGHRIIVVDV